MATDQIAVVLRRAVLLLFLATPAFAQFTQVSGTIVDPTGLAYSNGTISATLIPGSGASPTLNGASFNGLRSPVGLDVNGKFNMQLPDNNVVLPANSKWQFTVNIAPGIAPPLGTGPQSFSATITITGASQDISTTLNAAAAALRTPNQYNSIALNGTKYPFTDVGLNAAIQALPLTGGDIDLANCGMPNGIVLAANVNIDRPVRLRGTIGNLATGCEIVYTGNGIAFNINGLNTSGFFCAAWDVTTTGDTLQPTGGTAGNCTLSSAAIASGDVIRFIEFGF